MNMQILILSKYTTYNVYNLCLNLNELIQTYKHLIKILHKPLNKLLAASVQNDPTTINRQKNDRHICKMDSNTVWTFLYFRWTFDANKPKKGE